MQDSIANIEMEARAKLYREAVGLAEDTAKSESRAVAILVRNLFATTQGWQGVRKPATLKGESNFDAAYNVVYDSYVNFEDAPKSLATRKRYCLLARKLVELMVKKDMGLTESIKGWSELTAENAVEKILDAINKDSVANALTEIKRKARGEKAATKPPAGETSADSSAVNDAIPANKLDAAKAIIASMTPDELELIQAYIRGLTGQTKARKAA